MTSRNTLKMPKSKRYVKEQAHCRECEYCIYGHYFLGYRCIKRSMSVQLISFACADFYYIFAKNNPDWEARFIFGAKRTW